MEKLQTPYHVALSQRAWIEIASTICRSTQKTVALSQRAWIEIKRSKERYKMQMMVALSQRAWIEISTSILVGELAKRRPLTEGVD